MWGLQRILSLKPTFPYRAPHTHPLSWISMTPSLQPAYISEPLPQPTDFNTEDGLKNVRPKRHYPPTRLHSVTTQKITIQDPTQNGANNIPSHGCDIGIAE
jgi:hypothetical protein